MRRGAAVAGWVALVALVPAAWGQIAPLLPAPSRADVVLRRSDWLPLEPLSLEDLLRTLVGIDIAPTGAVGSPAVVQLAGSQNGRLQVVVDGVVVGDAEFEWPHLFSLQVSDIDSLEVSRATDPAQISIWTRRSERDMPYVDVDLGRGDLGTRTRRVEFFSPPRRVEAAVLYEELLRQEDDFRTQAEVPAVAGLGAYNGRGVTVRVGLNGQHDRLRLEYQSFEDESKGSVASQSDRYQNRLARGGLRYERRLGGANLCLAVGQEARERHSQQQGSSGQSSSAHTHAGIDARLPASGAWSTWMRLRVTETTGDRVAPDSLRADLSGAGAELQVQRAGRLQCDLRSGVHWDDRLGTEWSAAASARLAQGSWTGEAEVGRGISFPGWGEKAAAVRRGVDAALRLVWRRGAAEVRTSAVAKQFRGGSSAARLLPAAGSGPTSLGSVWIEAAWRPTQGNWQGSLAGAGGWTPYRRGEPSGLAITEARLDLRGGRSFRGGDLIVSLLAGGWLAGRREFADGSTTAPAAVVDLGLSARLLGRADLFASWRNLTDARAELAPGVAVTPSWWIFGLRVRLLD